ncbi:DUF6731 family protein [Halobacillus massiliensis]|uniref:DUF6731 family protein n=1 Tax=Halobacillus massiliensis TaxID=1926286 RepID=UPI0009E5179F|nr:DUF6731 family protein [Halobacillus massiliensis]
MSTTVQFYNCFLTKNGQETNVSFSDFLDGIISIEETSRYIENRFGAYSLIDMLMPNENPNDNELDRIVGFANYRERKPFQGKRGTDRISEITDDIFELTTALFIPTYHLALIEYNHFGARPNHIEEYLNAFLPKDNGNYWEFKMIAIETSTTLRDIRQSGDIRNIEIKLDLTSAETHLFNEEADPQSISYQVLNGPISAYRNIGANVATVSLGQGRYKSDPMDFQNLINMLSILDIESESFASIKVRYKSPTTHKLETADLKNEGLLKRVILEEESSTAFQSIGVGISDFYYTYSNRLASQNWREQTVELVGENLPIIRRYVPEIVENESQAE